MGKYFTAATFKFLNELEKNNERAWWEDNKDRYVNVIREPALEFINDFGPELKKISVEFVADSRTVGGSLMRPYRDVRFSKDKTPYKTNVGIQFRHTQGNDVHAPGFYLHIQPRETFAGVGLWNPEPKLAKAIRQAIYENPNHWKKAITSNRFTDVWRIDRSEDGHLKRVPKEFAEPHPYPDDLRLKTLTAGSRMTQAHVTSDQLVKDLAGRFRTAGPFAGFVCKAIGLPF